MTEVCPICQTPFPEDRLDGLCPGCFLSLAIEPVGPPGLVRGPEIARGGVGIVYEAQQVEPLRSVALKILQPQWADNEPVRERFRREARAMASLEHRAILPIYEVGETDGLPWFTMKLATGGSLAARISEFSSQWRRIAELAMRMARALGFAHDRGLLHRDVKPGNILFDGDGSPYLADFGLVKNQTVDPAHLSLTLDAGVLGTPNYLAPELAAGMASTATIACDIYSLGAVLYELLSGQPPHQGRSLPALLRLVADERPRALTEFRPVPPRDLVSICEKAMAREPEHRYATARELADDLDRYLRGEAVLARKASTVEAMVRWSRRHPSVAALGAIVVTLLATLAAGSTIAALRIRQAEREAVAARVNAEANVRRSKLAEAESMRRARQPRFRVHVLERIAEAGSPGEDEEMHVDRRSEAIAALAFPQLRVHGLSPPAPEWKLTSVASGLTHYAWRCDEGWRIVRDIDNETTSQSTDKGTPLRISRDGGRVAVMNPGNKGWKLFDTTQPQARELGAFEGYPEDFSDDGALVASYRQMGTGRIAAEVRETGTNAPRFLLEFPQVALKMRFNPGADLCAVAPSSYLNNSDFPYSVRLHRCKDGSVQRTLSEGMASCIWSMAWSRDGSQLAAAERGGATMIWNAYNGNVRHTLRGSGADMWLMAFSEDNRYMASISNDRLLSVFDLISGLPVARGKAWMPHGVSTMAWSASEDGNVFGPVSIDAENTLIGMESGVFSTFAAPDSYGSALGIAIAPNGRWLAVGDSRQARLWDMYRKPERQTFANGLWNAFAYSPDGRWLYGAGEPGVVRWNINQQGVEAGSMMTLMPPGRHNALAVNRGGGLAAESGTEMVRVFSGPEKGTTSFRDINSPRMGWLALDAEGSLLAVGGRGGVELYRTADGERLLQQKKPVHWVSLSPDGAWLVVARDLYEIWRTSDGTQVTSLPSRWLDPDQARATFTADGRWLATGHPFGKIALWNAATWQRFAVLESPNSQPVGRFAFDAKAARLYIASTGGVIETWDLAMLNRELKKLGLAW